MVLISNNDIARAIYLSTKDKSGTELRDTLHNVTKFLSRRRLLSKSQEILENLQKIINQKEGIVIAKVTSVEKLSHKIKEELAHVFKKRYSAKNVIFEEKLDEKLLGGMRVEVNNEVIDGSIKSKIGQLQDYLGISK